MDSRFILPLILRFLPSLLVLALGFYAATDKKSRQQWTQFLYQAGNLRPEQRDDPKVQAGVRVPFFVLAFLLIFLPAKLGPVSYYFYVTAKPEPVMKLDERKTVMDLDERSAGKDPAASAEPTATPEPQVLNPPPPPQPGGAPAPVSPRAPAPGAPSGGGLGAMRSN